MQVDSRRSGRNVVASLTARADGRQIVRGITVAFNFVVIVTGLDSNYRRNQEVGTIAHVSRTPTGHAIWPGRQCRRLYKNGLASRQVLTLTHLKIQVRINQRRINMGSAQTGATTVSGARWPWFYCGSRTTLIDSPKDTATWPASSTSISVGPLSSRSRLSRLAPSLMGEWTESV